jgi:hypothetical protein
MLNVCQWRSGDERYESAGMKQSRQKSGLDGNDGRAAGQIMAQFLAIPRYAGDGSGRR